MVWLPLFRPSPDISGGATKTRDLEKHEDSSMHKKLIVALAMLSVVAVAPLLSACHTTAGAGQDISATGQAIDKAAKKATP
jgi:predicted small secreted protein